MMTLIIIMLIKVSRLVPESGGSLGLGAKAEPGEKKVEIQIHQVHNLKYKIHNSKYQICNIHNTAWKGGAGKGGGEEVWMGECLVLSVRSSQVKSRLKMQFDAKNSSGDYVALVWWGGGKTREEPVQRWNSFLIRGLFCFWSMLTTAVLLILIFVKIRAESGQIFSKNPGKIRAKLKFLWVCRLFVVSVRSARYFAVWQTAQ